VPPAPAVALIAPMRHRLALLAALAALAAAAAAGPPASATAVPQATQADGAPGWRWPVDPPVRVLEPFRAPPTPYAAGHRGIDLASTPGDPVVSPARGSVSFTGAVAGRPVVAIDHGDGYVSAIEPVTALVAEGDPVAAGQPIGEVATGGHCDDRCVHFGVRLHGEYVSPLLLLGELPRSVLLPLG
jgi:murein DD-endopeptidase MepM/ murein hydrolase activator NlpD